MRSRKQTSFRRWVFFISLLLALLVVLLNWWQVVARRLGARSPLEQMLVYILSPSVRLANAARKGMTPMPAQRMDQPVNRVALDRLTQAELEVQQLRALLKLRNALPNSAVPADVIGRSTTPWENYVMLNKGTADGIQTHMIALSPDGVLGQVLTVTRHMTQVLPLTDRASGVAAMIARTRETGVLQGDIDGRCRLVYLSEHADVQVGDEVVTSGLSAYFPKILPAFPQGLPLGRVQSITDDPTLSSRTAIVTPAVNPATVEMVVLTRMAK